MGVIESLLEELNSTLTGRSRDSTKKARVRLAAAFGAYLGEVLRRADGGKWETTRSQVPGAPSIGLQCGDLTVFPIERVYTRLTDGPAESLELYTSAILQSVRKVD